MLETASRDYRIAERSGPGARVVLRADGVERTGFIVLGGFRGPSLPAAVTNARLESRGRGAWRLTGDQGSFEFDARAVDRIDLRPALYRGLHRPFALSAGDRLAARLLLVLLRMPGGAKLLRLWHARRSL